LAEVLIDAATLFKMIPEQSKNKNNEYFFIIS
jgi:hypothetical protein